MDTTPIYKKQCKAAFEDIGFIFNEGPQNLLIVDNDELLFSTSTKKETIDFNEATMFSIHGQLYRQDQLQEMVIQPKALVLFISHFHDFVMNAFYDSAPPSNKWIGDSMEQLSLAFVMHERFQKQWDSDKEQWVKER